MKPQLLIRHANIKTQKETLHNITFVKFNPKFDDVHGDVMMFSSEEEENKESQEEEADDNIFIPIYHFKQSSKVDPLPFQLVLVTDIFDKEWILLHEISVNNIHATTSKEDSWFPGYYCVPIVICGCDSTVQVQTKRFNIFAMECILYAYRMEIYIYI